MRLVRIVMDTLAAFGCGKKTEKAPPPAGETKPPGGPVEVVTKNGNSVIKAKNCEVMHEVRDERPS